MAFSPSGSHRARGLGPAPYTLDLRPEQSVAMSSMLQVVKQAQ